MSKSNSPPPTTELAMTKPPPPESASALSPIKRNASGPTASNTASNVEVNPSNTLDGNSSSVHTNDIKLSVKNDSMVMKTSPLPSPMKKSKGSAKAGDSSSKMTISILRNGNKSSLSAESGEGSRKKSVIFHNQIEEVNEVESWKRYNVDRTEKSGCCVIM